MTTLRNVLRYEQSSSYHEYLQFQFSDRYTSSTSLFQPLRQIKFGRQVSNYSPQVHHGGLKHPTPPDDRKSLETYPKLAEQASVSTSVIHPPTTEYLMRTRLEMLSGHLRRICRHKLVRALIYRALLLIPATLTKGGVLLTSPFSLSRIFQECPQRYAPNGLIHRRQI